MVHKLKSDSFRLFCAWKCTCHRDKYSNLFFHNGYEYFKKAKNNYEENKSLNQKLTLLQMPRVWFGANVLLYFLYFLNCLIVG